MPTNKRRGRPPLDAGDPYHLDFTLTGDSMSMLHALLFWATIATLGCSLQPSKAQECLGRTSPGFLNRIGLDRARQAYLLQTADSRVAALYAIQYTAGDSSCPTILDSLKGSNGSNSLRTVFEYECSVAGHKGEAAVALTKLDQDGRRLAILKVWLIDPRSLHFVSVKGKTTCSYQGYKGEDTGGDLLSWARSGHR